MTHYSPATTSFSSFGRLCVTPHNWLPLFSEAMSRQNSQRSVIINYIHTRARGDSNTSALPLPNSRYLFLSRDMSARNYNDVPYVAAEEEVESTDDTPQRPPSADEEIFLDSEDQEVVEEMVVDDGHASQPYIEDEPQFDEQNNDVGAIVEIESDNSNEIPPPVPIWNNYQIVDSNGRVLVDTGGNVIAHADNIVDLSTQPAKKRKL